MRPSGEQYRPSLGGQEVAKSETRDDNTMELLSATQEAAHGVVEHLLEHGHVGDVTHIEAAVMAHLRMMQERGAAEA